MSSIFSRIADTLMRRRSALPDWVNRAMESAARNPDGLFGRVVSLALKGADPEPTSVPDTPFRLYIGPTNYSGQGNAWAHAVERADPEIGARNVAVLLPGSHGFPADSLVPIASVNSSRAWAEAEWQSARRFSHVLIEAERSLFGRRFGRNVESEVAALQQAGVSVAFLCHGTDIRDPDLHSQLTPWSLYPDDPRTDTLRKDARANRKLLERLGLPVFISTPDLAFDVPWATWCPVIVDSERFAPRSAACTNEVLRIVHTTTNPLAKGSHFIEPALAPLVEAGSVTYTQISDIPAAQMPEIFASADIVIDQFRSGSFGVAACEAMAAGRVVLGHVLPAVRERVEQDTGFQLPIIETTPDTLREVVSRIATDRAYARAIAAAGQQYVAEVHTGDRSARALIDTWIRS